MPSRGQRRVLHLGGWLAGLAVRALLYCLFAVGAGPGCRCGADDVVATLIQHRGRVERDYAATIEDWRTAADGNEMRMGDGVRTLESSTAELGLGGGTTLDMTPKTVIRFLSSLSKNEIGVDVLVGEATLDAGERRVHLVSSAGSIVIEPKSRIAIKRDRQKTRFDVLIGQILVEPPRGKSSVIRKGQSLYVDIGGVILDQPNPASVGEERPLPKLAPTKDERADAPIAVTAEGPGVTIRAPGGTWVPVGTGPRVVQAATGLRVTRGATALIERGTQSATVGQGEFIIGPDGEALVLIAEGPARIRSAGASVRVPGGVIIAKESGTSADVRVGRSSTELDVNLGRVELHTAEPSEVRGGETASLTPDGKTKIVGRGPSVAQLVVTAGESFTVHDPSPPTVVGIRTPAACSGGAIVKTDGQRWASSGTQINIPLVPGRHDYSVHCLTPDGPNPQPVSSGKIAVARDGGVAPIAEKAPRTQIATDGRAYTVLYQNRLPVLAVTWLSPPATATAFSLHVSGASGTMTIPAARPSHVFQSGALREGRHTMYFSDSRAPARRSRATTVNIVYDSATPTASIRNPPGSMPGPGAGVTLTGSAVPGWSVSVDGEPVPVDAGMRFSASTVVPSDGRAVAIEFRHPQRGIHYYLRRPGGAI